MLLCSPQLRRSADVGANLTAAHQPSDGYFLPVDANDVTIPVRLFHSLKHENTLAPLELFQLILPELFGWVVTLRSSHREPFAADSSRPREFRNEG